MRKIALVAIAMIAVLGSMVVPFGDSSTVRAAFVTGLHMQALSGGGGYSAVNDSLRERGTESDSFTIEAVVNVDMPAYDDTSANNIFDHPDIFNTWDDLLDTQRIENSTSEGIFLLVGTGQQPTSSGSTEKVVTGSVAYGLDDVNGKAPKTAAVTVFGQSLKAGNIGLYLWGSNPAANFFGQKKVVSAPINVTGLAADTQYYAQLYFIQDTSILHPDIAISKVLAIKTDPAGQSSTTTNTTTNITPTPATPAAPTSGNGFLDNLECSSIHPTTWFQGCMVTAFYYIFVTTSEWIAHQTGKLFDAFAAVSLGSTIYGGGAVSKLGSFIENSWSLVRDIANIFFIFILLYAALGLVLSLHHFDAKKLIAKVIIIAILINFSLFFCHIAIDASNILSRVFYNAMDISAPGDTTAVPASSGVKEQSISGAIVNGVQPQTIYSSQAFTAISNTATPGTKIGPGTIFTVFLLSFMLNLAMAWIFFMCAAFFAGRIGVIWFSMIFAPLAFVSSIVPSFSKQLKQLGWDHWLGTFMKACFNAPIFFFFMYLIVNMVSGPNGGIIGSILGAMDPNAGWVEMIVGVMLPAMILLGLLKEAKGIAQDMAGEFGAAFAGVVAAGVGLAAMAATGGVAAVGSKVIGGQAMKTLQNQDLKDAASGDKTKLKALQDNGMYKGYNFDNKADVLRAQRAAGAKLQRADRLSKSSFDVRQTGLGNALSKATGVDMNLGAGALAGVGLGGMGVEDTAGGQQARIDRKAAKAEAFKKLLGQNDEEIHHKEDDNIAIDEGLKPHREDLEQKEAEQQSANNSQRDANEAIKAWKDGDPENKNKPVPDELLKAKTDADDKAKAANAAVDELKNGKLIKNEDGTTSREANIQIGGKSYTGVREAEKVKKNNEKAVEKLKGERGKSYVKFLKDQANSPDGERTGREMVQALRDGFREMGLAAAKGGAAGAGIGLLGAGLTGGTSIVVGALAGSIGGAVNEALSGGVLPAMKVAFTGATDKMSSAIAGKMAGGFDKNVAWSGKYKGEAQQVADQAGHKEQHAHKVTVTYKSPTSSIFSSLFSGAKIDAHVGGGGGGDHGGGGHH